MENTDALVELDRAQQLTERARAAGRWYVRYLLIFALASVLLPLVLGALGGRTGTIAVTSLWLVFLALISTWSGRQRTALPGMGRLHVLVIAAWALAWGVTVWVGSTWFTHQLLWWAAGGLAMAAPCLVGAWVARRRTAR